MAKMLPIDASSSLPFADTTDYTMRAAIKEVWPRKRFHFFAEISKDSVKSISAVHAAFCRAPGGARCNV